MPKRSMEADVRRRWSDVVQALDERQRRLWVAAEARAIGRGGVSLVSRATGVSRPTIRAGMTELERGESVLPDGRVRRAGGGRRSITETQPKITAALEALVEPDSRGDPQSPLKWTCKSLRHLERELRDQNFDVGRTKVGELLHDLGYSLQANRKTREGKQHPDRDAQFRRIADTVRDFQARGQPVISVDTKKKELVGDFKNAGREWHPKGQPDEVRVHDFVDDELGKAIPYGVYDLSANEGWVSVGTDHDTAEFAGATIGRWWERLGAARYAGAKELLIVCDGGGSNGSRLRLWKLVLQRLADELGVAITVCHFPPGTSKWNKIEHRLFSHITFNWRGKPLVSHEVIVNLIANTTTNTGLTVYAELDTNTYATGIKVTNAQWNTIQLTKADFHGEWNYSIRPNKSAA